MSISHPRTVFFVNQAASPCLILLVEMGSFQRLPEAVFIWKNVSMLRKRWHSICCRFVGPPWKVEMKSSRYTSTWSKVCPCSLVGDCVHC